MASPFFFVAGIVLGCVLAVPMTSGTFWVVQVSMGRGLLAGLAAAFGLAVAQIPTALAATVAVFLLSRGPGWMDPAARFGAAITLFLAARSLLLAGGVDRLADDAGGAGVGRIAWTTLRRGLAMRGRLLGYAAQFTCVSLQWRPQRWENAPLIACGVAVGALCWWLFFVFLARVFGPHVPEPITLRSLNKIRPLGALVLAGLGVIGLAPIGILLR